VTARLGPNAGLAPEKGWLVLVFDNSVVIRVASMTHSDAGNGIRMFLVNSTRALEENWIKAHCTAFYRVVGVSLG
jgi:hypothetical protein